MDPSVASLCHPWFTTTNLSYRFLILKLPPPPCAVVLEYALLTSWIHQCPKLIQSILPAVLSARAPRVWNDDTIKKRRSMALWQYGKAKKSSTGPTNRVMFLVYKLVKNHAMLGKGMFLSHSRSLVQLTVPAVLSVQQEAPGWWVNNEW